MTTVERAPSTMDTGVLSIAQRPPPVAESNALLKDLYEKKQNLRRIASEVGSMASELRDVRTRMATQEISLEQETARRQAAEAKAKGMEKELEFLHNSLEEKTAHAISTASVAEQYLRELVDVRAKLGLVQETADVNSSSVTVAQLQCKNLMKEIEAKNEALQEHEAHVMKLSQQLLDLQKELMLRDNSQKQLKEEVERMEMEMKLAVVKITTNKDSELKDSLEELCTKNTEHLLKNLSFKDEEIARQREEIRLLSAQLKMRAKELESQMDKNRAADQDLKKRVIKLEFWLQEARMQARKLQRIVEKKERELKDLRAHLASDTTSPKCTSTSFWGSAKLKIVMSVSVVALFIFAKR